MPTSGNLTFRIFNDWRSLFWSHRPTFTRDVQNVHSAARREKKQESKIHIIKQNSASSQTTSLNFYVLNV